MSPLETTFIAWLTFLSSLSADMDVVLNPPATDREIQTLENALGFTLPDELVALYKITNGQQNPYSVETHPGKFAVNLMGHYDFLSTTEALAAYRFHEDIWNDFGQQFDEEITVRDDQPVDSVSWKKGWLPIAGSDANQIAVDLAPPPGGTYGQLIPIGADEYERFVISPSLTEFFQRAANETGTDECSLDYGEPDNSDAHIPLEHRIQINPYILYITAQWNHPFYQDNCAEQPAIEQPDYLNDSNAVNDRFRNWLLGQGVTLERIDQISAMSSMQLAMIMEKRARKAVSQLWPAWLVPGGVIPQELLDSGDFSEVEFPGGIIPMDFVFPDIHQPLYFTELGFRLACQKATHNKGPDIITIDEYRLFHRYLMIEGIWADHEYEQAETAMRELPAVEASGNAASGSFSCGSIH